MSSIYITSRLHTAWKRSTKYWAAEMRRVCGEEGGYTRMAPRPSQSEPPPEEFGAILHSVLPYVQRGVNAATISAIISGTSSTVGGVPPAAMLPLAYYGGMTAASFGFEGMCLSYPREYLGCPFVPLEEFPLSRHFSSDLQNALTSFPPETHGTIVISAPRGFNFSPIQFTDRATLRESDLPNVHTRELERTGAPGLFLRPVFSQIRYTGCMRIATDAEIDALFELTILPDRWLKNEEINLRDFFNQIGADARAVDEACTLTDASLRAATPPSTTPSVTDVPARRPSRRPSVRDLVESATATPPSSVPMSFQTTGSAVAFSEEAQPPSAPRWQRSRPISVPLPDYPTPPEPPRPMVDRILEDDSP